MRAERDGYERMWLERNERGNLRQQHDMQLCKDEVRPAVEKSIRDTVDLMLKDQLENLKQMLDKKGGKKKKGKKKKGKKRKGKKKKGKKKKGKKKKGKKLLGEKFCAHMDVDQMLSLLIENQIINHYKPHEMADFIGEFNYLGSAYNENPDNKDAIAGALVTLAHRSLRLIAAVKSLIKTARVAIGHAATAMMDRHHHPCTHARMRRHLDTAGSLRAAASPESDRICDSTLGRA